MAQFLKCFKSSWQLNSYQWCLICTSKTSGWDCDWFYFCWKHTSFRLLVCIEGEYVQRYISMRIVSTWKSNELIHFSWSTYQVANIWFDVNVCDCWAMEKRAQRNHENCLNSVQLPEEIIFFKSNRSLLCHSNVIEWKRESLRVHKIYQCIGHHAVNLHSLLRNYYCPVCSDFNLQTTC